MLGNLSVKSRRTLEKGPEKGKRNIQTFKLAKDFQQNNFTLEQTTEKILESYNKAGVITFDFPEFEVKLTIESAYKTENFFKARMPFTLQKYSDISRNTKEVSWVVDKLFMESGLGLLSGVPKLGKSTIVRQLIVNLLKKERFLKRKTKYGEVHYFAIEEDANSVHASFKKQGLPPNANLYIHTGEVYSKKKLDAFFEVLKTRKPVLAVIDTLFDFIDVESENNYKEVKREMKRLRNIARTTGTHILCVHHNSKSGFAQGNNQILGSQAISGGVDTIFLLTNIGETRLVSTSGRGIKKWTDKELIWDEKSETYKLGKTVKIEL
jgi:predicted ATP-dependent serine protease